MTVSGVRGEDGPATRWQVMCCGKEIAEYGSYRAAARRCDYIRSHGPDHAPHIVAVDASEPTS